ncbi:hypothetical protein [Glaciimonas sp. PAMC28666]|uniref:hypothetical protein n=1 Tax=Glaciimonas sp. PAMC28666 TaxID=2807626 RepID=UPI0019625B9C|nr:hypothetical protein [Glaciimonas sp. PAMC28666]QRX80906.1 hypothetical protein JQN73_11780 [Glaciimonas sp. PAMC28666]
MDKVIPDIGAMVEFDSDHGRQTGVVIAIRRDITNAELCATVAVGDEVGLTTISVALCRWDRRSKNIL